MFSNLLTPSRRRACALGLRVALAGAILFATPLLAQKDAFPTNEAFRRAAAVEVIQRDAAAALELFTAIAQDGNVDASIRRHAWLRIGLLLPRVDDPKTPWATSVDAARKQAFERAAVGEDPVAQRAAQALAEESIDQQRWNDLERQAETLVHAELATDGGMAQERLSAFLWIGRPAVGPILRAIKNDYTRGWGSLMAVLVRIDDPRIDAWMEDPDTPLPEATVLDAFNRELSNAYRQQQHVARYLTFLPRCAEVLSAVDMRWSMTAGLWSVAELQRWCASSNLRMAKVATTQALEQILAGNESDDDRSRALLAFFASGVPYLAAQGPSVLVELRSDEAFVRRFFANNLGRLVIREANRMRDVRSVDEAKQLLVYLLQSMRPILTGEERPVDRQGAMSMATRLAYSSVRCLSQRYQTDPLPSEAIELMELGLDIGHGPRSFLLFRSPVEDQRRLVELVLRHCRENPLDLGEGRWRFDNVVIDNETWNRSIRTDWRFSSVVAGLAYRHIESPLTEAVWTELGPALRAFVGKEKAPVYQLTKVSSSQTSTGGKERSGRSVRDALLAAAKTGHPEVADWLMELWGYPQRDFGLGRIEAARIYHRQRGDARSREVALRVFHLDKPRETKEGGRLIGDLYADPAVDWAAVVRDPAAWSGLRLSDFFRREIDEANEDGPRPYRVAWKPAFDEDELARVWDQVLGEMARRQQVYPAFECLFLRATNGRKGEAGPYLPMPAKLEAVVLRHIDDWVERKLMPSDNGNGALLFYLWGTPREAAQRERYTLQAISSLSARMDADAMHCPALGVLPIERHPTLVEQLLRRADASSLAFGYLQSRRVPVPAERLAKALATNDHELASQFLRGVRRIADQDLTAPVSDYLLRRIEEAGPERADGMWEALEALDMIGEPSVIPAALAAYKRIPTLKEKAQGIIDRVRYAVEQARLWKSLGDDAPDLRPERVAIDLATQARPEQPKNVRLLAIRSLGALGRPEPLGELIRWSQEDDADVAKAAREAIAKILDSGN